MARAAPPGSFQPRATLAPQFRARFPSARPELTVISFPDPCALERPPVFAEPARQPGATLDHFSMRRRSATIGEQFWNVVARQWPGFNPIERTRWARLFCRFRSYWTPDFFSPEDRAFYDTLPDEFTAYRGQNGVELAAAGSFTLSKDVARGYALGRRAISYSDPTVLALRVAKTDVALAIAARDEEEIVLFPALRGHARLEALYRARITH